MALSSLSFVHIVRELGVTRGAGSTAQGGQDAKSWVRWGLTGSEGAGGGGAGFSPRTESRPGLLRLEMRVVIRRSLSPFVTVGGAYGSCPACPLLRRCSSNSFGCQNRSQGPLGCQLPFRCLILCAFPHKLDLVCTYLGKCLLSWGPSRGEYPSRLVPLICTLFLSSFWGRPFCPVMPKRKVTFQGMGNEDDEDEINVPKKKVRRPDSYILGKSEGEKKGTRSQKGGKALRTKKGSKGLVFHVL